MSKIIMTFLITSFPCKHVFLITWTPTINNKYTGTTQYEIITIRKDNKNLIKQYMLTKIKFHFNHMFYFCILKAWITTCKCQRMA